MRKTILFIISFAFTIHLTAQVTGTVIDSASKKPVDGIMVVLMTRASPADTFYTITNVKGEFTFTKMPVSNFSVIITNFGYRPVAKFIPVHQSQKNINLGNIIMANMITVLGEVIIESPPITIKEDTIEYRANAFKVKENSVVEDLLKKLPGVQVDKDGNIKAQGKNVTRVKVNGKDFFGGDPKTATRELPANIVDKVQIIDDYGDQATVSGIKDGDPDKVINLQLKKDKNTGYFGRATVGVGDKNRYLASINGNYFNNNRQISVFSNSNNTNQSPFNFGESFGSGASAKPGQVMNGIAAGGSVMNVFSNGDRTVFQNGNNGSDGITTSNSAGMNYRDQWSKQISVYGSYSYSHKNNAGYRLISQQNIFSDGTFINNQNNQFVNKGDNHRFNFNLEYNIDSFNYLKISPGVSYASNNNTGQTIFDFSDSSRKTSDGFNDITTASTVPNASGNILYNHRFRKRGRNFSVNVNMGQSENNLHQDSRNNTIFYVAPGGINNRLLFSSQQNNNHSNGIRFTYSEPLSKVRTLDVTFNHNFSYARNNKRTFDLDSSSGIKTINSFLSNDYENNYYTNRGNVTIRTIQKKYNYTLGVSIQPVDLRGFSISKDSAYRPIKRINIFPVARFTYNFSKTKSLNMNYRGDAQQPGFNQLQDVTDLSNPQYPVKGNPYLKPSINHNLNLFFSNFNFDNGRVIFTGLTLSTIQNQIINNIIPIGNSGAQLSIPQNVNGYYNANTFYNYSKPYNNRRYIISLNGTLNYNHNVNLIDSLKTFGNNWVISQGLNFEFNHKEWLGFSVGADYNLNSVKYNTGKVAIASLQNQDYSSWVITSTIHVDIPQNFVFLYDFYYAINNGLSGEVGANPAIMNASLEKQLFKKQNGIIKLQAFDLLNQNSNINRTVTANSIIDTRSNRLTRYVMLSFTYRLQKFKGKQ
jgi:Outer membrane protein beta-barrel family/Carboxypeptidase regulatory-like domain